MNCGLKLSKDKKCCYQSFSSLFGTKVTIFYDNA